MALPIPHFKIRTLSGLARLIGAGAVASALLTVAPAAHAQSASAVLQGWTPAQQKTFYSEDQGSRMIPLRWLQALKQADHKTPFLEGNLSRYGYLTNSLSEVANIPVGFTTPGGDKDDTIVGMTCSACHTREIRADVNGAKTTIRIDGGPAIVDFHAFLKDLDAAVTYALNDGWTEFANAATKSKNKTKLRKDVQTWYSSYHAIVSLGVPAQSWGFSRLDAVGMIFNRLTGLDLGDKADNYVLPENIQQADAPVRYPFLWNAGRQEKTQWPGFTNQSSSLAPLGRNVGEVFGVFAHFNPKKSIFHPILGVDYWNVNSVKVKGLRTQEDLITILEPPKFPVSVAANDTGKTLYQQNCLTCHGLPTSTARASWVTPIQNVGTDAREWSVLGWQANPGVLTGASIPSWLMKNSEVNAPLANPTGAIDTLQVAVLGTILQDLLPILTDSPSAQKAVNGFTPEGVARSTRSKKVSDQLQNADTQTLRSVIKTKLTSSATATGGGGDQICDGTYSPPCYESRVLYGIWAAAPYLHNGSVPTLWDLLQPASQRPVSFDVGADYDLTNVGLAKTQTGLKSTMVTTGCDQINSGNSRCGHEFGVTLSDADKWALIAYLKGL